MDQIIDILTIYERTRSINATFKAAKCSRNTVRSYLRLANARDTDLSVVLKLPPDELRAVFYPITNCPDCHAKDSLIRILLPPNCRAPPPGPLAIRTF